MESGVGLSSFYLHSILPPASHTNSRLPHCHLPSPTRWTLLPTLRLQYPDYKEIIIIWCMVYMHIFVQCLIIVRNTFTIVYALNEVKVKWLQYMDQNCVKYTCLFYSWPGSILSHFVFSILNYIFALSEFHW